MNIQEQIRDLEATRAAKAARMEAIMVKTMEEARTTDEAEAEEFDTLESEIKTIDLDLARLKRVEALNVQKGTARVVDQAAGTNAAAASASRSRTGDGHIVIKSGEQEDKFQGQSFTRLVIAKTLAQLEGLSASAIAQHRWGKSNPSLAAILKANEVAGGGSGSGEWGAELVQIDGRFRGDFISYLAGMTVFDKLALREVPENVTISGQEGIGTGYWVGQSKAIPATAQDFMAVTLTSLDVAALAVISLKLMRESSPSAEMLVRDALVEACSQRIDTTFLSDVAAVSGVSPAGLLRAVSAFSSDGIDGDGVRADIKQLYAPFISAKNASGLTFVMNPALAKSIQLLRNALGQAEFTGISQNGGTLEGDPVVTGDNVNANHLILLKPTDIYKIGDRGIQVSMSRDATIEMNSVPAGASDTPAASANTPVSMFQTESVAIKIVRPLNYAKRRSHVTQYIDDANYGAADTAA